MDADVVLGARPQVGEPALDGGPGEDGPVLAVLALVGEQDLVEVLRVGDGLDGVELCAVAVPDRGAPGQERAPGFDVAHLRVEKECFGCVICLKIGAGRVFRLDYAMLTYVSGTVSSLAVDRTGS